MEVFGARPWSGGDEFVSVFYICEVRQFMGSKDYIEYRLNHLHMDLTLTLLNGRKGVMKEILCGKSC